MKIHWPKGAVPGRVVVVCGVLCLVLTMACGAADPKGRAVLRLATTTSTRDSGLLEVLVPLFEDQEHCRVDVVAVGTGAALRLGEGGDAEAVLVHAEAAELQFMDSGFGVRREPVMYNRFVLLGPPDDPAHVARLRAASALRRIAEGRFRFVSRGDDSGTHKREQYFWEQVGGRPRWPDYVESGRGMGATLIMADELDAYVLSDEGTWRRMAGRLSLREIVVEGEEMRNPYSVMVVAPDRTGRDRRLADLFADFLISEKAQRLIQDFTVGGRHLFHPLRLKR